MTSFKIILGILFGILVASIAVLGLVSYRTSLVVDDTSQLVKDTRRVIRLAEDISSLSKDIQLESNGIFVSSDSGYEKPYYEARALILTKVENLKAFSSDRFLGIAKVDLLDSLVHELLFFGDSGLVANASSEEDLLNRIRQAKALRENFTMLIDEIKGEESRLMQVREEANQASIETFNRLLIMLLSGIALLLLATFFVIRYNFNKRIRVEQKLQNANDLFSRLFHESPVGIIITQNDSGVITDCNKSFEELINYSKEEMEGKTAVELNILESDQQREEITKDAREQGTAHDIETYLKPRDKEPVWVAISMQLISIRGKECLMSAVADMTSHRKAEEKIRSALEVEKELSKMKSNFVSMASHEFRTPLTTILSSAFLLEKYLKNDNEQPAVMKHIARVKSSVNNLTSILDEFLSVTKIEEGKIEPKIEKLNLKEYLQNVCLNFRNFTKSGQNIIYDHTGEDEIYSDPVLLGNIVNNLVTNAIKYSPENTDIHVSSSLNSHIHLKVKDMGIGIPEEDMKYLFERFYRASNAGTVQGTGLGLHIMKHYVDMLKGSVEVTSVEGKGTEFKLEFKRITPDG
ncbi:PAS domain S-box protein [Fulvivirga sp. 29W222]|uniref:histidine kinase n=1 Tax=Fulvivirga marina TaxID=2494733 RepID=A0A937G1H5_9BACT|nr:ATP-binding protein [Fulvivirga marina]MBL6448768.1 PAS domain S-box protein [Fulvivirga marina]